MPKEPREVHTRDAATGRVMHRAGESLLLLAVLAHAEGDIATGRDLMANKGVGGQAALMVYAQWFAEQLDLSAEFEATNALMIDDPQGESVRRRAAADMETVRREIVRRGW